MAERLTGKLLSIFLDTMAYDQEKAEFGHPGSVLTRHRLCELLKCGPADLMEAVKAIDTWADQMGHPSPTCLMRIPAGFSRTVSHWDFFTWAKKKGYIHAGATRHDYLMERHVAFFDNGKIHLFDEVIDLEEAITSKTVLERDLCMVAMRPLYVGRSVQLIY